MEHLSYLYNSIMGTRGPGAIPKHPLSGSEHSLGFDASETQPSRKPGNVAFTDPVGASRSDSSPALLPLGLEARHMGAQL